MVYSVLTLRIHAMSAFACCFWWFLLGALVGWLLNWLLSKWTRKDSSGGSSGSTDHHASTTAHTNAKSVSGSTFTSNKLTETVTGAAKSVDSVASDVASTAGSVASGAANAVGSAASGAANVAGSVVTGAVGAVGSAGAAAHHLLSGEGADVAKAAAAGFKISGNNDLEVIEGIGPKIAELFTNSGTNTFAKLASLNIAEMHKVLENGGSRFKLANPGSWAQQARLCHENRWSELKALQDTLDGGVHNADSHNA